MKTAFQKSERSSSVQPQPGRTFFFGRHSGRPAFFSPNAGRELIQRSELEDPYALEDGFIQPKLEAASRTPRFLPVNRKMIQRVKWNSRTDTGKDSMPWGPGSPNGDVYKSSTDGGTKIDIWRPHNGTTYWCHGYTFGGSSVRGGPFSTWGQYVPAILQDDGWKSTYGCMAQPKDILVFYNPQNQVMHSGIIRKVVSSSGNVDERSSTLESKWGAGSHNTKSWEKNASTYGGYRAFSKEPLQGACSKGSHELL